MIAQPFKPTPAMTTVHLLDGPFVTMRGTRCTAPKSSERVLAYVALRRTRVERRCLAGELWPEGDGMRSAGNLRSALWRLRVAGIDLIAADKWSLRLHEGVAVDLHTVSDWATRLIRGTATADDLRIPPSWPEVPDLLPGWYDGWIMMERERLRQRLLHALETLSRRLILAGRGAEAVEAAMLAVAAEPLRESAQRVLIEAHLAEGNRSVARRAHEAYRDLIQRELGVQPATDLFPPSPLRVLPRQLDADPADSGR
ncbi:BTAD domain-containing putative transcriptional regulator [Nonomuraea sp. NPDC050153]|uniref:AfsR/SARP family transcriptional regulator n=1 Tax=Nonomuraea sp. NPDC050153 TaxID=3364359 RepID=UPI003790234C